VKKNELGFHPEAAKKFNERTKDILTSVQCLRTANSPEVQTPDLHPVETIRPEDIKSSSKLVFEVDPLGEAAGVAWPSGTMRVGWVGPCGYRKLRPD